ncbi:MAG: hypothetical protein E6Q89_07965 [Bacteroidia bacterium]|nr:MAG: hypothetical protein E6Q89_07965 [Bacteroidia bacterium]
MKQLIILLFVCTILLIGCSKEKSIIPSIKLENVYEIKDSETDTIQQRVFKIYQKYKVPVYFNDTVGKVYVMDDAKGNPIYQYEKIDLSWTFSSYSKDVYQFEFMSNDQDKTKALNIIEAYLEDVSPSLRPFSFFVTLSAQRLSQGKVVEVIKNGQYKLGFRTVFLTGNWTALQMSQQPDLMKRQIVSTKILNYTNDVLDFSNISKSIWYGGLYWNAIEPSVVYGWKSAEALYDDWTGAKWYTATQLDSMRVEARTIIGKFGFIKGNKSTKGLQTPKNATEELEDYVQEILKYSASDFKKLWGNHPLVMKKYAILTNVIENKMQVKL